MGAIILILGLIGLGVRAVKVWGADEVRAEWEKDKSAQREREAKASAKAAQALSAERRKRRVVIQERTVHVDRIVERPVYLNRCLDADGLSCLESAVTGKIAAGCKPDRAVSPFTLTDGHRREGGITLDDRSSRGLRGLRQ